MKKRGILFGMILSCAVMTAWGCGNEKKLSSIEGDQAASSSSEDGGGKDSEDSKFKDDKSEDDNPFDTEEIEESGQEVLANYGWGIENFDAKKRELSYDGKTMEIDFSFDNSSKKFQAGILIFIDGIAQKYSLEPQGKEDYIIPVDIEKKENQIVKVYLEPRFEKDGESHTVHFASMYEPSYRISDDKKGYGAYHSISVQSPWSLRCKGRTEKDLVGNTVQYSNLTKEQRDYYIYRNDDGTIKNTLEGMKFEFAQDGIVLEDNAVDKNKKLELDVLGGDETAYRISAWLDGKPAKVFAGKEYDDFVAKSGKRAVFDLDFASSDVKAEKYSSLEFIVCPIAQDAFQMEYMIENPEALYIE